MDLKQHKYPLDEQEFNKFLVREYLKYGSVEEAIRRNKYDIPVSYANYQRVLDKWGVIKAAGPNSKLNEAISFLSHFAFDNVDFEDLYKKMPPSFKTSASTLYRILLYVKEGLTRRVGCALIITPYNDREKILVARDVSTPRIELGKKYGSVSLPMGYSQKRDSRKAGIKRILQYEVFSDGVIEGLFPDFLIKDSIMPFMYLDIADVRVSIYHIQLPKDYSCINSFSSYKLQEFQFMNVSEVLAKRSKNGFFRVGVIEAVTGYQKYLKLLDRNLSANPLQERSILNTELAEVVVDYYR